MLLHRGKGQHLIHEEQGALRVLLPQPTNESSTRPKMRWRQYGSISTRSSRTRALFEPIPLANADCTGEEPADAELEVGYGGVVVGVLHN